MQTGLLLAKNLELLWFKGGIFGIFMSYTGVVLLVTVMITFIVYMARVLRAYDISIRIFWWVFCISFFGVFGATLSGWLGSYWGVSIGVASVYGLLVGCLVSALAHSAKQNDV